MMQSITQKGLYDQKVYFCTSSAEGFAGTILMEVESESGTM